MVLVERSVAMKQKHLPNKMDCFSLKRRRGPVLMSKKCSIWLRKRFVAFSWFGVNFNSYLKKLWLTNRSFPGVCSDTEWRIQNRRGLGRNQTVSIVWSAIKFGFQFSCRWARKINMLLIQLLLHFLDGVSLF